jgi:hypothetical protein
MQRLSRNFGPAGATPVKCGFPDQHTFGHYRSALPLQRRQVSRIACGISPNYSPELVASDCRTKRGITIWRFYFMAVSRRLQWKPDPNQSGSKVLWCGHCNKEALLRVTHKPMKRQSPKNKTGAPRKRLVANCSTCGAEKSIGHKGMPSRR